MNIEAETKRVLAFLICVQLLLRRQPVNLSLTSNIYMPYLSLSLSLSLSVTRRLYILFYSPDSLIMDSIWQLCGYGQKGLLLRIAKPRSLVQKFLASVYLSKKNSAHTNTRAYRAKLNSARYLLRRSVSAECYFSATRQVYRALRELNT